MEALLGVFPQRRGIRQIGSSGVTEIVRHGNNGILRAERHADDIVRVVRGFRLLSWPAEQARSQVETFSCGTFQTKFQELIAERVCFQFEGRVAEDPQS